MLYRYIFKGDWHGAILKKVGENKEHGTFYFEIVKLPNNENVQKKYKLNDSVTFYSHKVIRIMNKSHLPVWF